MQKSLMLTSLLQCYRALREKFKKQGLDAIFNMIIPDAVNLDLFEKPGSVNEEMIDEWIKDLTVDGVRKTDAKTS